MKLSTKLLASLVAAAVVPAAAVGLVTWTSSGKLEDKIGEDLQSSATVAIETIERNLFERYGDVQAFGLNRAVLDRAQWYRRDGDSSIVRSMDDYVACYGIYELTLLVDTAGKVIAVNSRDAAGEPIETDFIYEQSFADADWFRDALAGNFLESAELDGTVVEDVRFDPLVEKVHGPERGLVIGYSAPVRDESGQVVAVWKNFASWDIVEDVVAQTQQRFAEKGWPKTEVTLLDRNGVVWVDCDPTVHGKPVNDDRNVIGKLNLAAKGVASAQSAIAGTDGFGRSVHARKQVNQFGGWSRSVGALGYEGLNWS
ncbi:MAG: cache domain-containing protein, partial [Planctomycetota bacterium]